MECSKEYKRLSFIYSFFWKNTIFDISIYWGHCSIDDGIDLKVLKVKLEFVVECFDMQFCGMAFKWKFLSKFWQETVLKHLFYPISKNNIELIIVIIKIILHNHLQNYFEEQIDNIDVFNDIKILIIAILNTILCNQFQNYFKE